MRLVAGQHNSFCFQRQMKANNFKIQQNSIERMKEGVCVCVCVWFEHWILFKGQLWIDSNVKRGIVLTQYHQNEFNKLSTVKWIELPKWKITAVYSNWLRIESHPPLRSRSPITHANTHTHTWRIQTCARCEGHVRIRGERTRRKTRQSKSR